MAIRVRVRGKITAALSLSLCLAPALAVCVGISCGWATIVAMLVAFCVIRFYYICSLVQIEGSGIAGLFVFPFGISRETCLRLLCAYWHSLPNVSNALLAIKLPKNVCGQQQKRENIEKVLNWQKVSPLAVLAEKLKIIWPALPLWSLTTMGNGTSANKTLPPAPFRRFLIYHTTMWKETIDGSWHDLGALVEEEMGVCVCARAAYRLLNDQGVCSSLNKRYRSAS